MAGERYTKEFKIEAVKQMTDKGHKLVDVAALLGISKKSLYRWRLRYGENQEAYEAQQSSTSEMAKLKRELKRVTEERDILKEAAVFFAAESKKNTRS